MLNTHFAYQIQFAETTALLHQTSDGNLLIGIQRKKVTFKAPNISPFFIVGKLS